MVSSRFKLSRVKQFVRWFGLGAVGVLTFHVVSTLLLAVIGLAPSSARWELLLAFAGVLAIAGAAVSLQSYVSKPPYQTWLGIVSGGASGAVLGFFTGGQLGDQQALWAAVGLAIGGTLLAAIAGWAYRERVDTVQPSWAGFWGGAIALISGLCAYGLAFGLGAWVWMALSVGRVGLAGLLCVPAVFYLWCTRRALTLIYLSLLR